MKKYPVGLAFEYVIAPAETKYVSDRIGRPFRQEYASSLSENCNKFRCCWKSMDHFLEDTSFNSLINSAEVVNGLTFFVDFLKLFFAKIFSTSL